MNAAIEYILKIFIFFILPMVLYMLWEDEIEPRIKRGKRNR